MRTKRNICRFLADATELCGMVILFAFCVMQGAGTPLNIAVLICNAYVFLVSSLLRRAENYYAEKLRNHEYEKELEEEKKRLYAREAEKRAAYRRHLSEVTTIGK